MAEIIQTKSVELNSSSRKISVPLITIIVSYILCVFMFSFFGNFERLFNSDNYLNYKVGDVVKEDIYSDSDVYLIDEIGTEKKRTLAGSLAFPVFKIYDNITRDVLIDFDQFESELNLYLETDPFETDSFYFSNGFHEVVDRDGMIDLLTSPDFLTQVDLTKNTILGIMNRGVIFSDDNTLVPPTGIIEVWRESGDDLDKTIVKFNQMPGGDNLADYISDELKSMEISRTEAKTVEILTTFFVRENCFPDEFQTQLNRDLAVSRVKPVEIQLGKGELILEQGLVITPEIESQLKAIREAKGSTGALSILSPFIFAAFLFAFAIIYFNVFSPEKALDSQVDIIIFSALTLEILLSYIILLFADTPFGLSPVIFIPAALFSMTVTLLADKKSGLIFQLIVSLALYYVSGYRLDFLLLSLVSGITGCIVIEGAARRIDMIRAGLVQGLSQAVLYTLYELIIGPEAYVLLWGIAVIFINGFVSSILALGLLPVLEHWLKSSTRFRLIELSDSNAPVLKNMLAKAPGTYIHSMNVANLAEMACQEIGANTLLARVGGLYHDIGKVDQSEYFIENQTDVNKHDDMKPSLSAAVLKAHVKIGIEKGHDLNLPKDVIEIIAQHHATSTMKYFYDRAMKEKGNTKVNRDDFSYSGPNPQTREAAVVMLADTIEAATRTLKKPSLAKLEKYVWELIMDKFINGELNDCSLTFKDMEYVKSSFVHVLAGHFHTRIEYPDDQKNKDKEGENE